MYMSTIIWKQVDDHRIPAATQVVGLPVEPPVEQQVGPRVVVPAERQAEDLPFLRCVLCHMVMHVPLWPVTWAVRRTRF